MGRLADIDLDPDPGKLRTFGVVAVAAFTALALLAAHHRALFSPALGVARTPLVVALGALAGYCGVAALLWPRANRPIYVGLSLLSYPAGLVLSYVLLAALFLVVVGPTALILRCLRVDLLDRRADRVARSYWVVPERNESAERYFRQY